MALVGRGLNNAEIGRELFMSPATAKTHVSRAMSKLHAPDRVQLAIIAHENTPCASNEPGRRQRLRARPPRGRRR